MDIIEQAREKTAEITSALRAAGLEPWSVSAFKRGDVSVTVEAPGWLYPVLRHDAGDVITAEHGSDHLGTFGTLAEAAEAIAAFVASGVVAKRVGDRWIARKPHGPWWGGATREEAVAAALAVQP